MKIRIPFIILFTTLLTANSAWAHSLAGRSDAWHALDHLIIAFTIAFVAFALFKIVLFFLKKQRSKKSLDLQDTLKKTSVNK